MDKNIPLKPNSFYFSQIQGNPFLRPASQDTYIYNMKSILRICEADAVHDVLIHPARCSRKIHTLPSLHTRQTYFNVVLRYLALSGLMAAKPELYDSWHKHHQIVTKKLKTLEANNMPSKRQERTMVPWRQVLKVRDALAQDPKTYASPEHLILAMYTYIPPRRQQDYARMRVYYADSNKADNKADKKTDKTTKAGKTAVAHDPPVPNRDHNFIDVAHDPPVLYVHEYKTAKFYKGYTNNRLPQQLVDIIRKSCEKQPREWLFCQQPSLKPFANENSFQKYSNRLLKRIFNNDEFTVNSLRHSFATFSNTQPFITVAQRQANAKAMGHSLTRNMLYALIKAPAKGKPGKGKNKVMAFEEEECYKRLKSGEIVPIPC